MNQTLQLLLSPYIRQTTAGCIILKMASSSSNSSDRLTPDYNDETTALNEDEEGDDEDPRGLCGLQNLGNTCYMNGALQALSNCQQLTRFILDCSGYIKRTGLCYSYSQLIREIWDVKRQQYAVPSNIIRGIRSIYPAFRGYTQQDTQEFLRCFLEQLHEELKQPACGKTKKKEKKFKSIVSDTFNFKILSSVQCSNCINVSTTKETFKDLSLPIPTRDHPYWLRTPSPNTSTSNINNINNINNYNNNSNKLYNNKDGDRQQQQQHLDQSNQNHHTGDEQSASTAIRPIHIVSLSTAYRWFWDWLSWISGWLWGPSVSLQDCLSIFFGADPLEGDNEYSCEKCEKKNRGVKYLKILKLPEILCIHFKRYESISSAKITTHVSFPLVGLQLAPFMSEDSNAQCTTYNLVACICHHGSALLTGHYTTYALNCFDDQWYEFDDQCVSMVQSYQVESCEAYILFYQRATLDDTTSERRSKASEILRQNQHRSDLKKYLISRQWINRFNTFVEPGPITNYDFLCEHNEVPEDKWPIVSELYHPITEPVWKYLHDLHGGGPECRELIKCDICKPI